MKRVVLILSTQNPTEVYLMGLTSGGVYLGLHCKQVV